VAISELAEKAYKQALSQENANYDALMRLGALAKTRGDTAEMHRIQLSLTDIDKNLAAEYTDMLGCDKAC